MNYTIQKQVVTLTDKYVLNLFRWFNALHVLYILLILVSPSKAVEYHQQMCINSALKQCGSDRFI